MRQTLNAPNDICAHPDGASGSASGAGAGLASHRTSPAGHKSHGLYDPNWAFRHRLGRGAAWASHHTYRWDRWRLEVASPRTSCADNGICFSQDYKRVYIISGGIHGADVANGKATGRETSPTAW
jgi:hypothetical protein